MDNIPIEYRDRILAEQMAMMEALQLIAQILICFALLVFFVILVVNMSGAIRVRHNDWIPYERRRPQPPEMATDERR